MKLIATADWHIRSSTPENRTDDFPEVQYQKLWFLFNYAIQENIKFVIIAGDVFNHFRSFKVTLGEKAETTLLTAQRYAGLFNTAKSNGIEILIVFGQHDLAHHSSNYENTPLWLFFQAGLVELLSEDPLCIGEDVFLYGCSFNETIPKIDTSGLNILVMHKMTISDKLWEGQEDCIKANVFIKKTDYNLIISGDNHQTFISQYKEKVLINPGSIMRTRIDQTLHTPRFFVVDTNDITSITSQIIPHEPFEKVINWEVIKKEKAKEKELEEYKAGLEASEDIKDLKYEEAAYKEWGKDPDPDVKMILDEVLS